MNHLFPTFLSHNGLWICPSVLSRHVSSNGQERPDPECLNEAEIGFASSPFSEFFFFFVSFLWWKTMIKTIFIAEHYFLIRKTYLEGIYNVLKTHCCAVRHEVLNHVACMVLCVRVHVCVVIVLVVKGECVQIRL